MKHQIPELVTNGFYKEALNLYTQRHSTSLLLDRFAFPSLFKACAKLKSPIGGQIIHAHLIKSGFSSDVYTATALSGMYMKLNLLSDALKVFDEMPDRNLVSLTSAISGLAHNGYFRQALRVFKEVVIGTFRPDSVTVASALSACESVDHGLQMHCLAIKLGVEMDVYVATSLMTMYWNHKAIILATRVFDEMPDRNLVSLTSAISGFAQNGYFRQALKVFKEAVVGTFRPNSATVASALSACESVDHGLQMHCLAIKLGVEMNVYVATSLMAMYSNQKEIILATRVFGEMPEKNVVSYSALFTGLLNNGFPLVVLKVFKIMRECSSETPNSVTFVSVISACADLLYLQFGRQVHGLIQKVEMQSDTMTGTALVDMYSKCGCLPWALNVFQELNGSRNILTWNLMISGLMLNGQSSKAMELFDQLAYEGFKPDLGTWNSMISGFSQQGMGFEAFKYIQKMQLAGTVPNLKCITSVLSACANCSALKCGKETHGHVIRTELNKDEFMATTLIYMYMKCGQPAWARRVFDQFEIKPDDPVFWNVMISGYRMNEEYESAVEVFDLMQKEKEVRMSTPTRKRLMRDFKRLQQDPFAGFSGAPQDNNIVL